jgi:hypothetical protein
MMIEANNKERLESINMSNEDKLLTRNSFTGLIDDSDIESQNDKKLIRIKGILKKTNDHNKEEEKYIILFIKIVMLIFILILTLPLIICDLYYGYTDNSCINEYPDKLNLNIKTYLLVSGYFGIAVLSLSLGIFLINIKSDFSENILIKLITNLISIFMLTWNIIGAVIFWGDIYNQGICNKNISTYLFVSLIIKLISNLQYLFQSKKKD